MYGLIARIAHEVYLWASSRDPGHVCIGKPYEYPWERKRSGKARAHAACKLATCDWSLRFHAYGKVPPVFAGQMGTSSFVGSAVVSRVSPGSPGRIDGMTNIANWTIPSRKPRDGDEPACGVPA